MPLRPSPCFSTPFALALALAIGAAAHPASAQTTAGGIALDPLEPTPTGDAFLAVPSPRIGGHLVPRGALLFEYTSKPLSLFNGTRDVALVSAQGFLRADVSFALWDRVLVSAHLPVAVLQSGEDPGIEGVAVRPPEGASLGDVRLGVRGRLVGQSDQSPLQLGLEGYVFAPTAPADQYVGEGSLRSDLRLLLGGRAGPVVWSASGGAHLRTSENPHSIRFGLGAAVLILDERVSLGLQTHGTYPLGQTTLVATSETAVTSEAQPGLELLAEARLRVVSGLTIGAAGGPGILASLGIPNARALFLLGWSPPTSAPRTEPGGKNDRDEDGFRDDVDACPDEKGEFTGDPTKDGCPPPDRDKDGVVDLDDACPLVNGDKNPDAEKNGCPNDGDGDGTPDRDDPCPKEKGLVGENKKKPGCPADADDDGVFDSVDACPSKAGISAPEPEQLGCPADMDNDGVAYPNDACPRERGPADAEKKGCPRFLKRNGSALETSRPVELSSSFSKSLSVTADSTPVLEEIRLYLEDHPEIGKLEVQGHTDDTGDVKKKLAISQDEAEIVVRALVDLGVPAARLAARGYGHKKPIADNRNPEGRRKNHRIAFEVLEGAK